MNVEKKKELNRLKNEAFTAFIKIIYSTIQTDHSHKF